MAEELTPEQEERVRRMLADARHSEPMPAEVADRMDRVVAGLAEDPDRDDRVVPLADRRRRAGRLLLAAAAVVAVGVGIGQVVGGSGESADQAGSAADSSEQEPTELTPPDRDGPREGGAQAESVPAPEDASGTERSVADVTEQRVRRLGFVNDARRARRLADAGAAALGDAPGQDDLLSAEVPRGAGCTPGFWGAGRYVPASYGPNPGWLVFRSPRGDTQVVDLFLCGEDDAERSATLPSP